MVSGWPKKVLVKIFDFLKVQNLLVPLVPLSPILFFKQTSRNNTTGDPYVESFRGKCRLSRLDYAMGGLISARLFEFGDTGRLVVLVVRPVVR